MRPSVAHAADALTFARVLLTPLFVWSFHRALADPRRGWLPAVIFVAVCASDVLDGPVARRVAKASARGAAFDAGADIFFVLSALGGASASGLVPWWVPASIALSFAYYVVDSTLLPRDATKSLIFSRIGHWGGIGNYVLVGVLTFNDACGLHALGADVLAVLYACVPLYSGAAILGRLPLWRRSRPPSL